MVKNNLFQGIFDEAGEGGRKNVGFVKVVKNGRDWRIVIDVKGLYRVSDWVSANYIINQPDRTYAFELGRMEIENGVGHAVFVVKPGRFLPDYDFDRADGIVLGDLDEQMGVSCIWGSESLRREEMTQLQAAGADSEGVVDCESASGTEVNEEGSGAEVPVYQDEFRIPEAKENADIFSDDEFCDCVEITPAQLGELKGLEKNLARNSFLVHGFYKYRHILLARPTEPRKENVAIVGVPGVYSNRERYMASLFGFCNFKKSHRSDFSNANFGYWYAEIYI